MNEYAIEVLEEKIKQCKGRGLTEKWYVELQKAIEILSNSKVIASGKINYKGAELMGTIDRDFIDVIMNKHNGEEIKVIKIDK